MQLTLTLSFDSEDEVAPFFATFASTFQQFRTAVGSALKTSTSSAAVKKLAPAPVAQPEPEAEPTEDEPHPTVALADELAASGEAKSPSATRPHGLLGAAKRPQPLQLKPRPPNPLPAVLPTLIRPRRSKRS